MAIIKVIFVLLMVVSSFRVDAEGPVKVTQVDMGKIEIDGRLTESAWREARKYYLENSFSGEKPEIETSFRFLWDQSNLYLGVVAEQSDMDSLMINALERGEAVWNDDSIELFLDPGGQGMPYFQIMVNAIGTIWEARYRQGRERTENWQASGLEVQTRRGEDSWTVEMRIPFVDLLSRYNDNEAIAASETWRFNLMRNNRGEGLRYLTYADLTDNYATDKYVDLSGIDVDYDSYRWQLGPARIEEVSLHSEELYQVNLNVKVENMADRLQTFNLVGVINEETEQQTVVTEKISADPKEVQWIPLELKFSQSGTFPFVAKLFSLPGDTLVARRRFNLPVDISPLELKIMYPYYRSAIYHDMEVNAIRLRVDGKWSAPFIQGDLLRLRIIDEEERTINEKWLENTELFFGDHMLDIPELSAGEYRCLAEVIRDEEVLYSADTPLYVYPPSESLVRINEHRNLVINGRETFPVGMFNGPRRYYQGQRCNAAIGYSLAPDLKVDPERKERFEKAADEDFWTAIFPYPRDVSPHPGMGDRELAMSPLTPEASEKITERVSQYQDVRGLLAWYFADEPAPTRHLPEYLEAVGNAIRKGDPYHPAYISFNNAGSVKYYREACDIIGVHWYVMFSDAGPLRRLSSVADHIKQAHELTDYRKPVINSPLFWMYSPSGDVRMPTHEETRNMAYQGIVHGAKGIIWYAACGFPVGLEPRVGMPVLIDELRALEAVFLAHEEPEITLAGENAESIHALGKNLNGELYIIAVNVEPEEKSAVVELPEKWNRINEIIEIDSINGSHSVEGGRLELRFAPYEVRIFSTCPNAPVLVTREELKDRFDEEHQRLIETGDLCYGGRGATIHPDDNFGRFDSARLLIDGYHDNSRFLIQDMSEGSQVEVRFSEKEKVGRIEVYSPSEKRFSAYRLEVLKREGWTEVTGEINVETLDDGARKNTEISRRVHNFSPVNTEALRLTVTEEAGGGGYPTGIRAFAQ